MKLHRKTLLVLAGYAGIVIAVFGSSLWPGEGMMIHGDDIHRAYYFFREFFNHWIFQGVFPWWNPYINGGEPFIANPIVNIWYPPTWMFVILPLNIAYSWHIAAHVWWAMVGMRMLIKRVLGERGELGEIGAWTGGILFGLSGFFMARTFAGHVDVIAAASWMPWVVWAMMNKSIPVASVVFALQLFAGYQTMAFFTLVAACFLVRPIWKVGFVTIAGVGLAAIQILPVQEFFRASIRTYPFPYSWISYGSITWQSLWQLFNPFFFGNQFTYHGPPPNFIEHSMFVGVGGLILVLIGGVGVAFFLIVVFGLWVSLGPNAPIDLQKLLWQTVPMYQYLRIPPRHLILVVFGLAALAGMGFRRVPRVLRVPIMGIIILEMVMFGRGFIEMKAVPEARHDKELISLLKRDAQPYRTLQNFGVWLDTRNKLDFDSTMAYGIYSATGYDPSILRSYFEYASGGTGKTSVLSHDVQIPYVTDPVILDRLNIKYLMVPKAYDPFSGNTRYRLLKDSSYRLYENTTVKPRFYFEHSCGDVKIMSYTPNTITLKTNTSCDTKLLSSEVWYPGWRAYIDGKRADITVSDGVFRTLFVPEGNHTVEYRYVPTIFVFGGAISVFTLVLLLSFL